MDDKQNTDYRWYVCDEYRSHGSRKNYTCIQTTFEDVINPYIRGSFIFIPSYVPQILDRVILKSKLADQDIKVEIVTNK